MKIAIFTDVFLEVPGGIPSSIRAQKQSLEALGREVVVFCPGWKESDDPTIRVVPSFPRWLAANGAPLSRGPRKVMAAVLAQFPEFEFDLVHVHYEASCSLAGMMLARKFKRPLVQTMHGREDMAIAVNVPHPLKTLVGAALCLMHSWFIPHKIRVLRDDYLAPTVARAKMWTLMVNHANFADVVLTPSQHFADKLKRYGVSRPITVVSNGVADEMVAQFDRLAKGKSLVRELHLGEPLRLIWNSRVSNEKRILPFLEAVVLMQEKATVEVFGDGNALEKAQKYARRHGLDVKFYGRVPLETILPHMLTEHLSITVSYGFDTQGLTLLEAEATGLPVFFVDPDMHEVVPHAGAVFAGPSPAEMAEALDQVCRQPEKIARMSEIMLKHRTEVLQSTQIKKLLKVYKSLKKP